MIRRGLTAIELLVALAVTGLAAGIGASTLALLTDHRDRLRAVATPTERAAAARRTLVAWLEGAHGAFSPLTDPTPATFELRDATTRGRPTDELLFTTTAATPLATGDALVRLYVVTDGPAPERGLVAEITAPSGVSTTRLQIDSTVVELDVRCLTNLLGERRWLPSWVSPQVVPRAVELRLGARRGEQLDPLLRLPILVAVEAGR